MSQLPSLSVLQSFEAAARYQSFSRAAQHLHVTQAAVSRKVRELESHLRVTLFRRSGRGVELTAAGHALAARLTGDLQRMRATLQDASAAGDSAQMLSIAVLPGFSARWLAPRLAVFFQQHPKIELSLQSRTKPFDMQRENVDLAIHFGRREWIGGHLEPLCAENLRVVVSPLFRERFGIARPEDFARVPLLHLVTRRNAWARYLASQNAPEANALRGTIFDQFSSIIAAAAHGLGAAIVPRFLIERELAQGTLESLDAPPTPHEMYYVVLPQNTNLPAARLFQHWLCQEMAA